MRGPFLWGEHHADRTTGCRWFGLVGDAVDVYAEIGALRVPAVRVVL